jgi:hypothetical protein
MEFAISNELKINGISRIAKEHDTIIVVYNDNLIRFTIYEDYNRTIKSFEKYSNDTIQDKVLKQQIILVICNNWLNICKEIANTKIDSKDNNKLHIEKIDIPFEDWQKELSKKYNKLRKVVAENIPELFITLEFSLSVKNILHISTCTLPFGGIILGIPSSFKTLSIELLRKWRNIHYSDSFSARSFVSHNTSVPKDKLEEIDLLPKIKNKLFLTPELSPIFSKKDDELIEILGILTRILDGHGYESDSGAHGHRGYTGEYMFTMLGAAVDIPRKVYRHLSSLGPKLYFLRTSTNQKTEEDFLKLLKEDNFKEKFNQLQAVLYEYLEYYESCPIMKTKDNLPKIEWNEQKDDDETLAIIVKLGMLLAHLRGVVNTFQTKGTQGSDYGYDMPTIEHPSRAITQLRNLAKGHALIEGRNYITKEDISILIKVVLSTAPIQRVELFDLLLDYKGKMNSNIITESLGVTEPTALRIMTELKVVGLVEKNQKLNTNEFEIKLKKEFNYFLTEEFQKLRKGFKPEHNSEDLQSKEKLPPTEPNFSFSIDNDQIINGKTDIDIHNGKKRSNTFTCPWCIFENKVEIDIVAHVLETHYIELINSRINNIDKEEMYRRLLNLVKFNQQ